MAEPIQTKAGGDASETAADTHQCPGVFAALDQLAAASHDDRDDAWRSAPGQSTS